MPSPYQVDPADLKPYEPPSLQQRISNAVDVLRGKLVAQPKPVPTPATKDAPEPPPDVRTQDDPAGRALPDANLIAVHYRQYLDNVSAIYSRRQKYAEYDKMDTGQIESLLDSIVDSCLVSDDGQLRGFKVEAGGKIETVLGDVMESTNLVFEIRNILRDTLKYGDDWVGYIFNENYNIVGLDNPPPGQMWTFVDRHMRLLTGDEDSGMTDGNGTQIRYPRAYQQKNDALTTVAGWYPFEMVHLKYRPSKRLIYSERSFLEGMRADYYKLKLIEEALVVHRATRSTPRFGHVLDVTGKQSQQEIEEALKIYSDSFINRKLSNNETVRDTIAVDEDYFYGNILRPSGTGLVPGLNDIKMFDPRNTGLTALPDVDYLVQKLFSRVPAEIVGILPDRQDISTQDIAASRFYAYLQSVLAEQFLRPMFNLALLLRGFRPKKDDYKILFPDVQLRTSWRFADAAFRLSMSESNELANGTNNRKNIAQIKHSWTDEDWEAHLKQFEKERPVFDPPELTGSGTGDPKAKKVKQVRGGNNSQ